MILGCAMQISTGPKFRQFSCILLGSGNNICMLTVLSVVGRAGRDLADQRAGGGDDGRVGGGARRPPHQLPAGPGQDRLPPPRQAVLPTPTKQFSAKQRHKIWQWK